MGGGLQSRCVGRVCGADGDVRHHPHRDSDSDSGLLETGQWAAENWTEGRWKLDSGLLETENVLLKTGQWVAGDWAMGCRKL